MPVNLTPSKCLCRAQLDTKIFSFWTSDFYRGKGLAAPAFHGKRAAADFLPDSLVFCH